MPEPLPVDLPPSLDAAFARAAREGLVLCLTGAGVSAASGIPTFRGPEGYWRVGAREFRPMELATRAAFAAQPDEVWAWYLYRRGVCRAAAPNAAHTALVALERALEDRFLLITQNVDGLHRRAGTVRHYAIHGDIERMRCARECTPETHAIPEALGVEWAKGRQVAAAERALLRCPRCGGPARPHVLWFDETYDEPRFRWDSSLAAAARASLLVVAGTSGATNLPLHVASVCASRGVPMVVVNLEPSPFTALAEATGGVVLEDDASRVLPALVARWVGQGG